MKNQKILFISLFSFFSFAFKWETFSIKKQSRSPLKIQALWTLDTLQDRVLRPQMRHRSPPLITEKLVVQGNSINGIKTYKKDTGKLLWSFKIKSGVSSPVVLFKGNLYFGGADGFFYNLQLDTGQLNWKFFTGSENLGAPLISDGRVYWTASNQKIYALSLKGKLLWIYSGSPAFKDFILRGRPRPAIYKNSIYTAFHPGKIVALDKKTGRLKWEKQISSSHSVREDLEVGGSCLFVPVFNYHLFCLNLFNGKVRWKTQGASASFLSGKSVIYQSYKGKLSALKKSNGKLIWKKKAEEEALALPVAVFKNYLIYGFPSKGYLLFVDAKTGDTLRKYKFGRGLATNISVDQKNKSIYFLSIDAYLHKLKIL